MRTPVLLYGLALGVRLVLVALFPDPAYPDSYYYVDVARALAAGQGFTVDFIWIFAEVGGRLPAEPVLPIPSNAHWMPLASLVQVPFIALLGPTALASALPFALIGALAAPLAWAIARDAGASSLVATGAGLLVAVPALSLAFMPQPDNFSLYQPLAAGALWMGARALRGDRWALPLGGLLVGLATLSRNDGILLGSVLALVFAWDRWRAWRSRGGRVPAIPLTAALACAGLFLLVMGPWWLRQLATFGHLSPSAASGKALFIRSIDEWNSITTPATLDHFLGQGLGPLVASRLDGLVNAIVIFAVLGCGIVLAPAMLLGAWRRRRSVDFGPFLAYAAIFFAFSALVSAVHVPGGTFIHSAVALLPHGYVLALEGIVAAVAWAAARRATWNGPTAARVFAGGAIAFTFVVAAAGVVAVHDRWRIEREQRLAVAEALDAAGAAPSDRLMTIDAAGYRYYTGRGGVVLVNDPVETVRQVAEAYDVRWLVVERDDAVPAVAGVLDGDRPEWIGAPIWQETDRLPPDLTATEAIPVASIGLYPVCLTTADPRCEVAS